VTLEVYNVKECSQFSKEPVHFRDMKMAAGGEFIDMQWEV
jgi:hypothetical protein